MFTRKIKSALIAATIALGAITSTGGAAQAGSGGGIYLSGGGIGIEFTSHRRHGRRHMGRGHGRRHWGHGHRRHRYDRRDRWDRADYRRNSCNPRKAVRKARRKGIRHAHVVRVNRRGVLVAGRKWGDRVLIGFDRSRRCQVRFVRSR